MVDADKTSHTPLPSPTTFASKFDSSIVSKSESSPTMEEALIDRAGDTANHAPQSHEDTPNSPDSALSGMNSCTTAPQNHKTTPTSPDSAIGGMAGSTSSCDSPEFEDLDEMMPSVEVDVGKHVEISSRDDVTPEMRIELQDIVELIKTKHCRSSREENATMHEVDQLLERVFRGGWTTRHPYFPPNYRTLRELVLQTTTQVAMRQPLSPGPRLINKPTVIYIVPKPAPPEILEFHFVGPNRKPVKIRNPDVLFDADSFVKAMREYDTRQFRTVGGYNRAWAVFFARGRLVHWANGNGYSSRPDGEDFEHAIVSLRLCRDCSIAPFSIARVALEWYQRHTQEPEFDLEMDQTIPRSVG